MRLKDKVALVTGAGSGNGAAIAMGFAKEGAKVVFADLNHEKAHLNAEAINKSGGTALALQLDVTDTHSINSYINTIRQKLGDINILVNNAGVITRTPFLTVTELEWDNVMAVNAKGVFFCSQAVAQHMVEKQQGGVIINISSISAFVATPNTSHYGASKGAVSMLTKHMALDLGPHQIRVNAIAPGTIRTAMTEQRLSDPQQLQASLQRILIEDRVGVPEDLVGAAIYLASDESRWVTGTTINIDGGYLVR
jgi:NAD(P)-dependent dehydrogenase (short-subunit alcohol dehydrogenase family)